MSHLMLHGAGAGNNGIWTPASIPGLQLWLRADLGPLKGDGTPAGDGDPVATWSDQSGNGFDAVQATVSKQPTLKTGIQNGLNVVRFDGVDDGLITPSISLGAFTAFAVVALTTQKIVYEHSTNTNSGSGSFIYGQTSSSILIVRSGILASGYNANAGNGWIGASATQLTQRFNGTNASHLVRANGSNVPITQDGGASDPGLTPTSKIIAIASRNATSLFSSGDYMEFLVYNAYLSDANMGLVEANLKTRWATP